ncbi:hypothetical protein [Burkholderia sp. AU6039]|uniref:hypothetical protein n=1 Tax=Burkholderia sp. AU6039 TaxID=2015344 RepID=UPI00117F94F0|nr:hypothetical protein [Burkholderia sp. AU6039]
MAVTFNNNRAGHAHAVASAPRKRTNGHTAPKPPAISLDQPGRIRVANFQALLGGISGSAFYQRLKLGRIPQPCGNDGRPYWRTEVVKKFLET